MSGLAGLKGKHLLWLVDFSTEEIQHMISLGLELKRRYYMGEREIPVLKGRSIALIFEKPSTRTRVSLEVGIRQLGGNPLYLSWAELQLGRGETIADTARVLSRYVDAIVARVKRHETLVELSRHSRVPVINGLSDKTHPLQALGDMMTIYEKKGRLKGVKLVFVGDGSDNVLNSLIIAGAKLGLHITVSSPPQLRPDPEVLSHAMRASEHTGALIEFIDDPLEAVRGADIVYTDVWVSMGQEEVADRKRELLKPYQVNEKLMERAGSGALFMHCLPAVRGEEVTDGVIDGPSSIVWDQAENRLHVQKAVLSLIVP
jgi:ornithine carbamoyltransferase